MELSLDHMNNEVTNPSSENILIAVPDVNIVIEKINNDIILLPAPFFDELHFANYE